MNGNGYQGQTFSTQVPSVPESTYAGAARAWAETRDRLEKARCSHAAAEAELRDASVQEGKAWETLAGTADRPLPPTADKRAF